MSTNKKALAYVRSATDGEEAQTSLDLQTAEIDNLAREMGSALDLSDVLREIGSGLSLERPQLNKVRLMAAAQEFDALLVYSPDRLSRDWVDLAVLLQEFDSHGVEVHFVYGPSANAPQAKLVSDAIRYGANRARSRHRERTARGMDSVARSGRMPTGVQSQPFGYDLDVACMRRVINEAEARTVVWVFGQYAEGWNMTEIAEMLNAKGVTTRAGKLWNRKKIRRMLSNTSYMGVDYYGKTRSVGGKRRVVKPWEEWIEIRGYTPALISEALFQKAQERLAGLR